MKCSSAHLVSVDEDRNLIFLLRAPRSMPSLLSRRGWWLAPTLLRGTWWPAVVWTICAPSTTSRARTGTSRSCVSWRHTQVGHLLMLQVLLGRIWLCWMSISPLILVSWGSLHSISFVCQVTFPAVASSVTVRSSPAPETAPGENIVRLTKLKKTSFSVDEAELNLVRILAVCYGILRQELKRPSLPDIRETACP